MSNVVRFPPLPPLPEPFTGPLDPRQETYYRITGNLLTQILPDQELATTDVVHGFRASAVDVGALQEIIEESMRAFDMKDVKERWDADLGNWVKKTIVSWIQRCKFVSCDLAEKGVHITIESQDDRGYYRYEFDVFPGRKH